MTTQAEKNASYTPTRLMNPDNLSTQLLADYNKQQDTLEVGESVLETSRRLQAERRELRQELRGHSHMFADPYRVATAEAEQHRIGLLLTENQRRQSDIGSLALAQQKEEQRIATDDLMHDESYRESVQLACVALAEDLEPFALVAAMNRSALAQGLQMPPGAKRAELVAAVEYFKLSARRGLFDLDDLSPCWSVLLAEGGL